jgi:probable phosphoglycerate mutase
VVLVLSLVRHGQSEYNAQNRLQGWCDSPLTAHGLAGVRAAATHLAAHPFTAAYVSPAGRAQTTAHEILAHHPHTRPVTDPDLRKFGFGDLEAHPQAELGARYDPDVIFAEVVHGTFAGLPGGEPGRAYLARVRSAFTRIEHHHPGGHVLVVSHDLTLRTYLAMIDPRPMTPLPNASITTVEVHPDGHRRVLTIALNPADQNTRHVTDAPPTPALAL